MNTSVINIMSRRMVESGLSRVEARNVTVEPTCWVLVLRNDMQIGMFALE
jgi:hypothetical protein